MTERLFSSSTQINLRQNAYLQQYPGVKLALLSCSDIPAAFQHGPSLSQTAPRKNGRSLARRHHPCQSTSPVESKGTFYCHYSHTVRFRKGVRNVKSYQSKVGVRCSELDVGEFVDVSLSLQVEVLFYRSLHVYCADISG